MSGTVTLAELVTRVRRRADLESATDFMPDIEVEEYIEGSLGALYDLVLSVAGPDAWLNVTEVNSTVVDQQNYRPTTSSPTLAEIYKIIAVEVLWQGKWRKIRRHIAADDLARVDLTGWNSFTDLSYRTFWSAEEGPLATSGNTSLVVAFTPIPKAVHSFRVKYVPTPGNWSTLGGTYRFEGLSGWEEWVICDAASKAAEKGKYFSLSDRLTLRRAQAEERVRWAAASMDLDSAGEIRVHSHERNLRRRQRE